MLVEVGASWLMGGGYNCECILKNLTLPKDSSGLCPQQGDLQDLGMSVRSLYVCLGASGHQIVPQYDLVWWLAMLEGSIMQSTWILWVIWYQSTSGGTGD